MEAVIKAEKQDKDNAGLWIWWRRRELNPRPKALLSGFYMFVLPT